jgi:hypothetical protein
MAKAARVANAPDHKAAWLQRHLRIIDTSNL